MMLSRISKMGVFGIVALMLMFGLATTDALAAKGNADVQLATSPAALRAATAATLTFTVDPQTAPTGPDDKVETVTISIPHGWSAPIYADDETSSDDLEVREVLINNKLDSGAPVGDAEARGFISTRSLVAKIGKAASSGTTDLTFAFKTDVPPRKGTYRFNVRFSGVARNIVNTPTDTEAPAFKRTSATTGYFDVVVGPVNAGASSGKISLSGAGIFHQKPADKIPHRDQYIVVSEAPLNMIVTFEAAGTLPKNSTIKLTLADDPPADNADKSAWQIVRNSDYSVSGNVDVTPANDSLTAKVKAPGLQKGNKVVFTVKIKDLKVHKLGEETASIDNWTLTVGTNIDIDDDDDANDLEGEASFTALNFVITKKHGTGALSVHTGTSTDDSSKIVNVTPEHDFVATSGDNRNAETTILLSKLGGIGNGSKYEITIPQGWDAGEAPFKPIGTSTIDGVLKAAETNGDADFKMNGYILSGDILNTIAGDNAKSPNNNVVSTDASIAFTYYLNKAPKKVGAYTFKAKTSSGPHGALTAIGDYTINVLPKHGSGTMSLAVTKNGKVLDPTPKKEAGVTLTFTYTPPEKMLKGAQVRITMPTNTPLWTIPRPDNGDGVADAGEVSLQGKASLAVTTTTITATATSDLTASDRLVFTYKNVTVPDATRSDTFTTMASSFGEFQTGDNAPSYNLASSPSVGIGRPADGKGTLAVNPKQKEAGAAIGDLVLTYTAEAAVDIGSMVEITIPSTGGWPAPNTPGAVVLSGSSASLTTTETTMTATVDVGLSKGDTIVFTYKNITAPAAGGQYTFTAKSTSSPSGSLTALAGDPITITINEVASGSIVLADAKGNFTTAAPGMEVGNLVFTFTATASMGSGAQVEVTIPTGWSTPFADNNDGVDAAGEVSLAGNADLSVSGGGGQPWMLTATTTAALVSGNTLSITYKNVTAPTAEAVYPFTVKANLAAGANLLPLASSPLMVTVRAPVDDIAIAATPSSVFTGGEISLTVTLRTGEAEGKALGNVTVSLADGEAGGTFTPASITIADNMSSGTAIYTNATAGNVTITATSGAMTDTVDVEIKSTISNLQVNGMEEPGRVASDARITVTAVGQSGEASVRVVKKATDADGNEVVSSVVSKKGLDQDPNVEVSEGSVAYTREFALPDLDEDTYTVEVTIAGETAEIDIEVVASRAPVTALTLTPSADNFFAGESITVTVGLDSRAPIGGLEVTLSTDPADSGTFSMTEGGDAITTVMIEDSADSMSAMVYYTNSASGAVKLMAASGDDLSASVDVTVKPTITVQVNGMDEPDSVLPGATISVTAVGKAGGGTVMVADAAGDPVGSLTGLGLNVDADAADVPEGSVAYMRDVELPAGIDDGTYTVTVNIGSESVNVEIVVATPPTEVDAIAIAADPTSVFVGEKANLNITLWSGTEAANAMGDVVVMLKSSSDTSALAESVKIADGENGVMTTFSDTSGGTVTITATSDELTAEAIVEVKPTISNLQVNGMDEPNPVKAGDTITVSATGKEGKATVTVTDAEGIAVVPSAGLKGLDEESDEAGNIDYTRDIDLPTSLTDGMYTVTVTIAGDTATIAIEAINDQSPPALSNQKVLPDTVTSGSLLTLTVDVSSKVPNAGLSVMADVSEIDADAAAVQLMPQNGTDTYAAIYVVKNSDPKDDGEKTITFTATDRIGGKSTMTATTSLRNDVTPPALSDASATPSPVVNGMDVTISVNGGESGLTVTADASAIGGDADVALSAGASIAGADVYSSEPITVSVSASGDQTVTIKAVDGSGNEATVDVTVTVEVHEVTSVTFSPAQASTGESVMVTAMGTAGLTAMFNVFDADGMNIVDGKSMDESDVDGTYMGSFTVVVDMHPAGEYWVSASIGTAAAMTADGSLTIEHQKRFTLSIPRGTHAIHIPLAVDGIETVGDLYDALGDAVNFIITLGADGNWMSYLGDSSAESAADAAIGDDTGLIAVMKDPATLELVGDALGTGGTSMVSVGIGNNLVGVPLDPAVDMMISDALVAGVEAIAISNAAGDGFHTITAAGDAGDGAVMGGVGYIVVASAAANIPIIGSAWENDGAPMAAPAIAFSGSQTPVLHVDGGVMDEFGMLSQIPELSVTVKNLSTGASLDTVLGTEESATSYSATFVEFGRHAAKAGDVLEIVAHSPSPFVGVRPVPQIVVSAEEVLTSRIKLPDLELYEIPSETELLANYPNPFNPETWIPYRLAKAAEVTLEIYDTNGRLVRSIDVGFKPAAVYESRASAIYWDGRNNYGERVASGTYFYHLTAGDDFSSTRRMVILK